MTAKSRSAIDMIFGIGLGLDRHAPVFALSLYSRFFNLTLHRSQRLRESQQAHTTSSALCAGGKSSQ